MSNLYTGYHSLVMRIIGDQKLRTELLAILDKGTPITEQTFEAMLTAFEDADLTGTSLYDEVANKTDEVEDLESEVEDLEDTVKELNRKILKLEDENSFLKKKFEQVEDAVIPDAKV